MTESNQPSPPDKAHDSAPPPDPTRALHHLMELATKYPEIGPPLAELAFKIGETAIGDRIVRMGLDREGPGLEYYFVAANTARRDRRYDEARKLSVDAVKTFAATPDEELADDDGTRLLHLVRLGFSTMLFDEKNPGADESFVGGLAEALPKVEARLGTEAFFHAMMAQVLWYTDRDQSEQAWGRADSLGDPEFTWNARGTWYKDAEHDLDKAADSYRRGLGQASTSPLLLHNLAQVLVDKAEKPDADLEVARALLREADAHLRNALREEGPKGLRRHIHATRDRLNVLRSSFPPRGGAAHEGEAAAVLGGEPERELEVNEVVTGRVCSVTAFGVFVSIRGKVGLLHKTEMSHEWVDDPAQLYKIGDEVEVKVVDVGRRDAGGKLRISLSRKALLPVPEAKSAPSGAARPAQRKEGDRSERRDERGSSRPRRENRGGRDKPRDDAKFASLGEMLLAKMKEQSKK